MVQSLTSMRCNVFSMATKHGTVDGGRVVAWSPVSGLSLEVESR